MGKYIYAVRSEEGAEYFSSAKKAAEGLVAHLQSHGLPTHCTISPDTGLNGEAMHHFFVVRDGCEGKAPSCLYLTRKISSAVRDLFTAHITYRESVWTIEQHTLK